MTWNQRFDLLDLVRDDGVKSFRAIETATGRPLLVHFFVNADAPLTIALLGKVDRLPLQEFGRIVDRGEHQGVPYLVTDRLPDYPGLREWLEAMGSSATAEINPLNTAGAWKAMGVPTAASPNPKSTLDDQFASLFEAVQPAPAAQPRPQRTARRDEKTEQIPAPPLPPSQPAGPPPGPFTQMLQTPIVPAARAQPSAPASPAMDTPGTFTQMFQAPAPASKPAPPQAPAEATPGAFTQLFQAPGAAAKPAAPVPPPVPPVPPSPPIADATTPGAFTQLFQAPGAAPKPAAPAPPPVPPVPPSLPAEAPGAFTQLFQAPGAAPKLAPSAPPPLAAPAAPPGEFTQLFEAPPPSKPASSSALGPAPVPGEFTQMFQPSPGASKPAPSSAPPPSPPGEAAPGEFTQLFQSPGSRPQAPGGGFSPPQQAPQGEFTRLFEAPNAAGPMPRSPAVRQPLTPRNQGSAGGREGEFTRVFGPRDVPAGPPSPPPSSTPISSGATQTFATQQPTAAPIRAQEGPGDFTRAFAVQAPLPTLGQPTPDASKPSGQSPGSALPEASSRLPLILGLAGIGIFVVALILFFVFRSK